MPKIQRLNLGLERANNLRIRSGLADNVALSDGSIRYLCVKSAQFSSV